MVLAVNTLIITSDGMDVQDLTGHGDRAPSRLVYFTVLGACLETRQVSCLRGSISCQEHRTARVTVVSISVALINMFFKFYVKTQQDKVTRYTTCLCLPRPYKNSSCLHWTMYLQMQRR